VVPEIDQSDPNFLFGGDNEDFIQDDDDFDDIDRELSRIE
jgi:hypothetical protein